MEDGGCRGRDDDSLHRTSDAHATAENVDCACDGGFYEILRVGGVEVTWRCDMKDGIDTCRDLIECALLNSTVSLCSINQNKAHLAIVWDYARLEVGTKI